MDAAEKGLVTAPACRTALKFLSRLTFGGGARFGDDELSGLLEAHQGDGIIAPTSVKRDDGEWVQFTCGCDIRMVT